eukprot:6202317-Pleurochrysis_carterae.AAC.1
MFITLGDVINREKLTTVQEFTMLTLEELNAFAAEAGFQMPADGIRLRVKLSQAFHNTWLPAQKMAAPHRNVAASAESAPIVVKKRGGARNTMDSIVPPLEPLPGFDPRQVRLTRTFYSLFPAATTVEYLSCNEETELKNSIVLLLKAYPDPSIGERASKSLLEHIACQLEGKIPPLKPSGKFPLQTSRGFAKNFMHNLRSHASNTGLTVASGEAIFFPELKEASFVKEVSSRKPLFNIFKSEHEAYLSFQHGTTCEATRTLSTGSSTANVS